MNIVIAGAGEVGTHLAHMLSKQKHQIMLIDGDKEKLELIESQVDILSIVGSCTSTGALRDAGVERCDLYIAVNQVEEQNITSAILAKRLGAKQTIARVNNSEYLEEENSEYLKGIGIDSLIYPERLAAEEIVNTLKLSGSRQIHEFSDGRLQFLSIKLWENAPLLDLSLIQMAGMYAAENFRVVAIKRGEKTIVPRGNDRFAYGDMINIVTKPSYIPSIFTMCGKQQHEIRNIVVVGGTRIGIKTASLLEKHYNVKLIEPDREKCILLADKLRSTLIINGSGQDLALLREEGIRNTDAFISVTDSSEINILSCLLAKKLGVKKSIAEVENFDYIGLAESIGLGTLINTKVIAASHIYRHTMNVDVKHLRFLTFSEAEVFEVTAEPGSKITRHALKEMRFPENATIGGVIRGGDVIIAKGDTLIEAGDNVVVFALPDAIKKVLKLFHS
ncbi:MAG: Trk system potassium transporter TrkA [Odoribacteraceae bacterium]|jgi:trk system potassium uptake protein TrkA|nr:Trk system potassium transporter TrkA [Odoribacteraceae bacterium]